MQKETYQKEEVRYLLKDLLKEIEGELQYYDRQIDSRCMGEICDKARLIARNVIERELERIW